jgi:hypothetical protein
VATARRPGGPCRSLNRTYAALDHVLHRMHQNLPLPPFVIVPYFYPWTRRPPLHIPRGVTILPGIERLQQRDRIVTAVGSIRRNDMTSTLKRRLEQLEQSYWRRTLEALGSYLEGNRSQPPLRAILSAIKILRQLFPRMPLPNLVCPGPNPSAGPPSARYYWS